MTAIKTEHIDVLVIGGGPAGMAAAIAARLAGARHVAIVERGGYLGGILNQCIHNGFGLELLKKDLTGPEYAQHYIDQVKRLKITVMLNTMAIDITKDREVTLSNSTNGLIRIKAGAIVLAMGCRERTAGMLSISGTRPAGIYTAGVAQTLINLKNLMVGKRVVILGSGDIGLIMARRLTLEGAKVISVVEKSPYPGGLLRNVTQCLEDFDIPLILSHTIIEVEGRDRLESVTLARVDRHGNPLKSRRKKIKCDTLLISAGLIPENELSKKAGVRIDEKTGGPIVDEEYHTSVPGIFACGNVVSVHDIVDWASMDAEIAGASASLYSSKPWHRHHALEIELDNEISYCVPQILRGSRDTEVSIRVKRPIEKVFVGVRRDTMLSRSAYHEILIPSEALRVPIKAGAVEGAENLSIFIEKSSSIKREHK